MSAREQLSGWRESDLPPGAFEAMQAAWRELGALEEQLDAAEAVVAVQREALTEIKSTQPAMLEKLRALGIVFDDLGADPTNWQHVAFSIYNALCEVDLIASQALDAEGVSENVS